jgi:hypothetical protein
MKNPVVARLVASTRTWREGGFFVADPLGKLAEDRRSPVHTTGLRFGARHQERNDGWERHGRLTQRSQDAIFDSSCFILNVYEQDEP